MTASHPLTEKDWAAIAVQARGCKENIILLIDLMTGKVDSKTINKAIKNERKLNQLRSSLEDEMCNGGMDPSIFYRDARGKP